MAKTIYLWRHAKTANAKAGERDFDRALTAAGTAQAEAVAACLTRSGIKPGIVLCSTSLRTRQTLAPISAALGDGIATEWRDDLYHGGAETLLGAINEIDDRFKSVLLVGHNPAMHELATALVGTGAGAGDSEARQRLAHKFSRGALVVIDFRAASWRKIAPRGGQLQAYVTAKMAADQNVPG
jgi:phosphohistidine phosphatase